MPDGAEQSPARSGERLKIGAWTVEPALNQLSTDSRTLKLEPKAMALLRYLAERPGQVVSREALLSAVWPGVVVGDDSLTQAVIKLRKALGDVAESPAYIQTIPKSGYRLVAEVVRLDERGPAPVAPDPGPAGVEGKAPIRRAVWGALVVLLFAAACYRWLIDDGGSPIPSNLGAAETERAAQPAISVRPLEALGEDAQAVLLAQGITADLVTDLSKVFGLSVIAPMRSTAPADAEMAVGAPVIRYFLSGSVQRADDRLRLHVRLTDAQTGAQLWSERFDRPVGGLFVMQEELVAKILQILPAKVSEAELRRVAQHHTRNLEAYEYFQRGQKALLVRQRSENETARQMFKRAIELDAAFARAYAGLALTYAAEHRNQWTGDGARALDRAFELARTANEINPGVRETYWVLGFVHLERGQHKQALQHLETAIRLSPSFADAYALMGGIHVYTGQPAEGLPLLRTAMRLNPEAGYLYFLILGRAYFALGDLEQARVNLAHALLRNPVNVEARVYMAALYARMGNRTDAMWEAEEIRALQPGFSARTWLETHPLTDAGVRAQLIKLLGEVGL